MKFTSTYRGSMQEEYDTDHSSESSGVKLTDVAKDSYIIDILSVGDVVNTQFLHLKL